MAKKGKFTDKLPDGVSVKEIESFAKRYASEVFTVLAVIIATISSTFDFFSGPGWSLGLAGICAVIALLVKDKVAKSVTKFYDFVNKQEQSTQIILGVVRLVVALFLPFVIFAGMGFLAGVSYANFDKKPMSKSKEKSRSDESSGL